MCCAPVEPNVVTVNVQEKRLLVGGSGQLAFRFDDGTEVSGLPEITEHLLVLWERECLELPCSMDEATDTAVATFEILAHVPVDGELASCTGESDCRDSTVTDECPAGCTCAASNQGWFERGAMIAELGRDLISGDTGELVDSFEGELPGPTARAYCDSPAARELVTLQP